jgi:hypothetical protein
MTPDVLPLWRDVLTLQQELRPEARATLRASHRPAHPIRATLALLVVMLGIVFWSAQLQFLSDGRARSVYQEAVVASPPLLSYLTTDRIALAWAPITGALAAGAVCYLILLAIPASRRFVRKHPVTPVALGSALVLLILQLTI